MKKVILFSIIVFLVLGFAVFAKADGYFGGSSSSNSGGSSYGNANGYGTAAPNQIYGNAAASNPYNYGTLPGYNDPNWNYRFYGNPYPSTPVNYMDYEPPPFYPRYVTDPYGLAFELTANFRQHSPCAGPWGCLPPWYWGRVSPY